MTFRLEQPSIAIESENWMSKRIPSLTVITEFADAVIVHCAPPWFPRVATLAYFAVFGFSLLTRLLGDGSSEGLN